MHIFYWGIEIGKKTKLLKRDTIPLFGSQNKRAAANCDRCPDLG